MLQSWMFCRGNQGLCETLNRVCCNSWILLSNCTFSSTLHQNCTWLPSSSHKTLLSSFYIKDYNRLALAEWQAMDHALQPQTTFMPLRLSTAEKCGLHKKSQTPPVSTCSAKSLFKG
jgi:hypothetical protein